MSYVYVKKQMKPPTYTTIYTRMNPIGVKQNIVFTTGFVFISNKIRDVAETLSLYWKKYAVEDPFEYCYRKTYIYLGKKESE